MRRKHYIYRVARKTQTSVINVTAAMVLTIAGLGGVIPAILSQTAQADASTFNPVEDVTQTTYYSTIQEAVNAASPNDVIKAQAGTYNENVTVNKSLTIEGANSGVAGFSSSRSSESVVTGSFDINASNVTINGFTIDASSGSGITMLGSYSGETIEYNVIDDNGYAAVFNTGTTNFSDNQINYGSHVSSGIEANNTPNNNIHFFNNHFSGSASNIPADITIIGGSPVTEDVFVDDNTSTSGTTLVALFNTRDATITRNTSTGAQGSAIYIGGGDSYVTVNDDNVITGAITAVNVTNSSNDGVNSNVTINDNQLDTTNATGVNVSSGAYTAGSAVNATENWWGSASGPTDTTSGDGSIPDTNQNGTGSTAMGAIEYDSWCTLSDCSTLSNVAPGMPTNLTAKFQYDSTDLANGSGLNVTTEPGGNSLELEWSTPAGWVNGYQIISTYPNGNQSISDQGPNTNAWLVPNGFGQHGQGAYTYQVVAVNNSGQSAPSASFTLVYDTTAPVVNTPVTYTDSSNTTADLENATVTGQDTFNVSQTESNPSKMYIEADIQNGSKWDKVSGQWFYNTNTAKWSTNTTSWPNGQYELKISTSDVAGNSGSLWVPFTVNHNVPAQPTNLTAKFQNDSQDINNGSTLNKTAESNSNNLELLWNSPTNDWVTGYHIVATYPDGSTQTFYQGPNTNAWLATYDGYGQHGQGKYSYEVVGVNPNGTSTPSSDFVLYYDTTPPTATLTQAPADNSYVNGDFYVSATASDNVGLNSVFFDVRSQDGSTWKTGCVTGTLTLTYTGDNQQNATLSCEIDTSGLVDGTTYLLRVHADDNAGYGNVNSGSQVYFTFDTTPPTTPVASLAGGSYVGPKQVSLSSSDSGSGVANIYYTTDGSTPSSTNGTLYTGTLTVSSSETIEAIAYDNAGNASGVLTEDYTILPPIDVVTTTSTSTPTTFFGVIAPATTPTLTTATTAAGSTSSSATTTTTGHVLGDHTTTPATDGHVKGDSTVKDATITTKPSQKFLSLGWWWLLILAVIVGFLWFLLGSKRKAEK